MNRTIALKRSKKKRGFKKKVYLSSLPSSITEAQLSKTFAKFGKITLIKITREHQPGSIKTYCSIKFEKAVDVKKISEFEQKVLNRPALGSTALPDRQKFKERREERASELRVFVSNIPQSMSDYSLQRIMGQFGNLEVAYRLQQRQNNKKLKYGLAHFFDHESVRRCLETKFIYLDRQNGAMMFQPFTDDPSVKRRMKEERKSFLKRSSKIYKKRRERKDINRQHSLHPNRHHLASGGHRTTNRWLKQTDYQQLQNWVPVRNYYQLSGNRRRLFKKRNSLQNMIRLKQDERVRLHCLKPSQREYWNVYADRNIYLDPLDGSRYRFNRKG